MGVPVGSEDLRPVARPTTAPAVPAAFDTAARPTCSATVRPMAAVPFACSTTLPAAALGSLMVLSAVSASLPTGFFGAT